MPNFWTATTQQLYECFKGPRTQDFEFEKLANEVKLTKEKVNTVRSIIINFPSRTSGLHTLCNEIFASFSLMYSQDKSYFSFIDDVCQVHKAVEKSLSECKEQIGILSKDVCAWDKGYLEIENEIVIRNEARKTYDHYDEKIEELVKERNLKLAKNKPETIKDVEKFERNENKYREAAKTYINLSNNTYIKMQDLLDSRYQIINPSIVKFVKAEREFFIKCAQAFNYFDGIEPKIKSMESAFRKTPVFYNALDYLRGRQFLGGINDKDEQSNGKPQGAENLSQNQMKQNPNMNNPMKNQMNNPMNNQMGRPNMPPNNNNYGRGGQNMNQNMGNPPYQDKPNNPNLSNPYYNIGNFNQNQSQMLQNPYQSNIGQNVNRSNSSQMNNPSSVQQSNFNRVELIQKKNSNPSQFNPNQSNNPYLGNSTPGNMNDPFASQKK